MPMSRCASDRHSSLAMLLKMLMKLVINWEKLMHFVLGTSDDGPELLVLPGCDGVHVDMCMWCACGCVCVYVCVCMCAVSKCPFLT